MCVYLFYIDDGITASAATYKSCCIAKLTSIFCELFRAISLLAFVWISGSNCVIVMQCNGKR